MGGIDHLVYAVPDLAAAMTDVERRLGVRPALGGQHPAWGTRNALLSLGRGTYLEVIGPDPEAAAPGRPRPFGLDELKQPRLVAWACREAPLEPAVAALREAGLDLGRIQSGSRVRADGARLEWRLTDLFAEREGGVVPFLIDWGSSPHPSADAPTGVRLNRLEVLHPDPDRISRLLRPLGLRVEVCRGEAPGLRAWLEAPTGDQRL